ncbi:MAG: rhomboid family protein [Candidatus Cloacimonetes bacterium]|nr:rhomboid family protein [Candidatus Cloacimonadota bacterium]
MSKLSQVRCHNHIDREAVSLCKHCHNYFCRECISDYDDKMLCKSCIDKLISNNNLKRKKKLNFKQYLAVIFSSLLLWFIFYSSGNILISISDLLSSK